MNITVIGAGYVGLVTGACFSDLGNHVTCVDLNQERIQNLRKGVLPIYEPGLDTMVKTNMDEGRLKFATSLQEVTDEPNAIFIAVGTPSGQDGSAEIKYVLAAAKDIGQRISQACVIVDKSTVPVGMADQVRAIVSEQLSSRGLDIDFDVVSNPEFLREGAAIKDFMEPDRVVIGLATDHARKVMQDLYLPILQTNPERLYFMNVKDAEMTKYAANAMLATRISFMNELSVLCEKMGVDIENVRKGMGSDARIGPSFLNAGCGYGGSCFPKDVRALMRMAENHGMEPKILKAVEERNYLQKQVLHRKVTQRFGEDLSGVRVAVWGLAFKPETDDMREASSLILIENLIKRGATVLAYDPEAMAVAKTLVPASWFASGQLTFCEQQYDVIQDADVLVLVTEWKPFRYPDLEQLSQKMRQQVIIDGRNQYDPEKLMQAGFEYSAIGRGGIKQNLGEFSEVPELPHEAVS